MKTTIYVGDSVILTTAEGPFATAAAPTVPADPSTVTINVVDPAGAPITYTYPATVSKDSTGVYRTTVTCPIAGRWRAVITGTGVVGKSDVTVWDVYDPLA